jgi:hypothetical protein
MTHEQIDQLEAGPELDALIAEKVMGWTGVEKSNNVGWELQGYPPNPKKLHRAGGAHLVPDYSTEIPAAWLVVEKLGFLFTIGRQTNGYIVVIYSNNPNLTQTDGCGIGGAKTAPLAICRAALKTVMGEKK